MKEIQVNKMKEGWGKVLNLESRRMTTKYHYFREGTTLCGKYMLEGGDGFLDKGCPLNTMCKKCLKSAGK